MDVHELSIALDNVPGMTWVIRNTIEQAFQRQDILDSGYYLLETDILSTTRRQVAGLPVWANYEAKVYFTSQKGIGYWPIAVIVAIILTGLATFAFVAWSITSTIKTVNTADVAKDVQATNLAIINSDLPPDQKQDLIKNNNQAASKAFDALKKPSESSPFGDISNIFKWVAIGLGVYLLITALPALKSLAPQRANPVRRRYY